MCPELRRILQPVEKLAIEQVGTPDRVQTPSNHNQNTATAVCRARNGARKRPKRSFSTGWVILRTSPWGSPKFVPGYRWWHHAHDGTLWSPRREGGPEGRRPP